MESDDWLAMPPTAMLVGQKCPVEVVVVGRSVAVGPLMVDSTLVVFQVGCCRMPDVYQQLPTWVQHLVPVLASEVDVLKPEQVGCEYDVEALVL